MGVSRDIEARFVAYPFIRLTQSCRVTEFALKKEASHHAPGCVPTPRMFYTVFTFSFKYIMNSRIQYSSGQSKVKRGLGRERRSRGSLGRGPGPRRRIVKFANAPGVTGWPQRTGTCGSRMRCEAVTAARLPLGHCPPRFRVMLDVTWIAGRSRRDGLRVGSSSNAVERLGRIASDATSASQ